MAILNAHKGKLFCITSAKSHSDFTSTKSSKQHLIQQRPTLNCTLIKHNAGEYRNNNISIRRLILGYGILPLKFELRLIQRGTTQLIEPLLLLLQANRLHMSNELGKTHSRHNIARSRGQKMHLHFVTLYAEHASKQPNLNIKAYTQSSESQSTNVLPFEINGNYNRTITQQKIK